MSDLKISPNLFLEKQELDRLKRFLVDDGFKSDLLANSDTFGLIKKDNTSTSNLFDNSLVEEDTSLTIKIKAIAALDNTGKLITSPVLTQIAVPSDNLWYWVKIAHQYSTNELGTFSIDTSGNLVCTSANAELKTILRGQPNYPSRISFTNAINNVLEYDILEVIDDQNAILQGSFISESNLKIAVVGTFTPGYVPLTSEKFIFQYDSCLVTLVQNGSNFEPVHTAGVEFFIARVRNNGVTLYIEDKRNEIWTVDSNFFLKWMDRFGNPLIGVEQITYDDNLSPKESNILSIAWGFRSLSYSVNPKLNTITLNSGLGGIYKDITQVVDESFNNWRLYVETGEYFKILSNFTVGSSIVLTMEQMDANKFFSDSDSVSLISQQLLLVPNVEEIEIICKPNPASANLINERKFLFPINTAVAKVKLNVYSAINTLYNIKYRYKMVKEYGPVLVPPDDSIGFYNESQFNSIGQLIGATQSPYVSDSVNGYIPLQLHSNAYSIFETRVDIGDIRGVDEKQLSNANQLINLHVGTDKEYQFFNQTSFSLSQNLFINLSKTKIDAITLLRDGNHFTLNFARSLNCNGYKVIVCEDFINPSTYNSIVELDQTYFDYVNAVQLPSLTNGFVLNCIYDQTSNFWIGDTANDVALAAPLAAIASDWVTFPITLVSQAQGGGFDPAFGGTLTGVGANSLFRYKIIGKTLHFQVIYNFSITGGGIGTGTTTQISINLATIFKTSMATNYKFRGTVADYSTPPSIIFSKIENNSGHMNFNRSPAANFDPGTYEYGMNGVINIQ